MTRIVLASVLLCLALTSCSSQSTKKQNAAVEEHGGKAGEQGGKGVQTYGAGKESQGSLSELNNPQSPLAVRIIYFDYDSSDIQEQFRPTVEAHAAYLAAHPDATVSLEGHADERGSREYNLALGERRAQAVKQQMVLLGADANQIRTTSYGEERPAVEGHNEAAWAKNRRVEIIY